MNIENLPYHPTSEDLVKVLQNKTQNSNPLFFRVIVAYYFALVAGHMRVNIKGWAGRGTIPVNVYAFALSPSGSGKGHSVTLMENEVLKGFKEEFLERTFPISAEASCENIAQKRALKKGTDFQDELEKIQKDFNALGALLFSFDSATTPAIKQMRQKLLMANAGSANLQVDEIGANFSASIEPLTTYLELFDKGLLKDKLVKSSTENTRFERIDGYTPANMLLFGTPSKLLDGAKTEEQLMQMLEMGYARRCFFGFTQKQHKNQSLSVEDAIKQLFSENDDNFLETMAQNISALADLKNLEKSLILTDETIKTLVAYKLYCEQCASELSEYENIKKSELMHRYFKVMKLAGVYAFIDGLDEITPIYVHYAIKLAQDSGEAFARLLTPQRAYVKLANYLAQTKSEVTLVDLDTDLPCFKGSKAQKDELILMATAWGYKNNILIKKSYANNILFLYAESITKTNLDNMIISYTNNADMTTDYINQCVSWEKLPTLFTANGYHWINHHLKQGYRREENALMGFNLLVLDVDGSINLSTAQMLLKDYKAYFYETKRSTNKNERFRIILPTNYILKLDAKDYKQFYQNVLNDIPFAVDTQCAQRAKKWLSCDKNIIAQDGELFDILPYIPKTSKNEERARRLENQQDLDNLERWILNNSGDGNRNNMLLRYALILLDAGFSYDAIKDKTLKLNDKLADSLSELELVNTIFHTLASKMAKSK